MLCAEASMNTQQSSDSQSSGCGSCGHSMPPPGSGPTIINVYAQEMREFTTVAEHPIYGQLQGLARKNAIFEASRGLVLKLKKTPNSFARVYLVLLGLFKTYATHTHKLSQCELVPVRAGKRLTQRPSSQTRSTSSQTYMCRN